MRRQLKALIFRNWPHGRPGETGRRTASAPVGVSDSIVRQANTANLRTNIMDFRGFDSSIVLILRGGILMSIGDSPESLSQAILVGIMLVGRLGVLPVEVRCYISCVDVSYETPDVTPCRASPPMPCFVHVSRESPDVTPCHTSLPQGVKGDGKWGTALCV